MICIPIKPQSLKSLLSEIKKANNLCDVIEIWFDELQLDEAAVKKILSAAKKDVLYKYMGNRENLDLIVKHKLKYIDLDLSESKKLISGIKEQSPKTILILSAHDFKTTPSTIQLNRIASKMKDKGADIVKIAATAKDFSDTMRMLSFLKELNNNGTKAICLCMGKAGALSRAAGHLFGNYLMYAPIHLKNKTASGQITVEKLQEIRKLI
jgi:3-dehydroquinate dehydratase type I